MFYFSPLGLWCTMLPVTGLLSDLGSFYSFGTWLFLSLSPWVFLGFLRFFHLGFFIFYTVVTPVGLPIVSIVLIASFPRVFFTSSIFTFLQLPVGPYTSSLYDVC